MTMEEYHARIGGLCPHAKALLGEDYRCGNLLGCASCRITFEEDRKFRDTIGICMGRFDSTSKICLEYCPKETMERCIQVRGMPYSVQRQENAVRMQLRAVVQS